MRIDRARFDKTVQRLAIQGLKRHCQRRRT